MSKYEAKVLESLPTKPGCWDKLRIGVFRGDEQIGEYGRNYSCFYDTFYPFTIAGKDYALYSPHYTATRVMELPSCRDIGGEDPNTFGFCPTGYYVPEVRLEVSLYEKRIGEPKPPEYFVNVEYDNEDGYDQPDTEGRILHADRSHLPFGFVQGCVWGDDSGWKVEHLDMSKIAEGKIQRTELIGYREIPSWLPNFDLKKVVHLMDFNSKFVSEEQFKADPPKIADVRNHRFLLAIKDESFYDWDSVDATGKRTDG